MSVNKTLKREQIIRLSTVVIILSLCALAILVVEGMLLSFVLAFVINYLLSPFVNALERAGMVRSHAVTGLYGVLGTFIVAGAFSAIPHISGQLAALQNDIPRYSRGISDLLIELQNNMPMLSNYLPQLSPNRLTDGAMSAVADQFFSNLPNIFTTAAAIATIAPLFAFFMLADGQRAIKKLLAVIPNNLFETSLNLLYQINNQIGGFIRARLLEATIVGVIVWGGLTVIDAPYAVFLGVFAGLTNLVPYIGPFIGAVPAIMISLINNGSDINLWMILSVYTLAQLIDNLFIIPLLVAKIVDLHAIIVIVVLVAGAQLGGILGMIISIPIASIIKLTAETVYHHLMAFRA